MEYKCDQCNKKYASYQSLWIHNKKKHTPVTAKKPPKFNNQPLKPAIEPPKIVMETVKNKLECEYCNYIFTRLDSLKKHHKICKKKSDDENQIITETDELKNKITTYEKIIEYMQSLVNTHGKIPIKTLNKINKQVNTMNNMNNSNNTTINCSLVPFGQENLNEVLTQKEKVGILKTRRGAVTTLVKYVNVGDKYPQYKNIAITNMQNDISYILDNNTKRFIAMSKKKLLTEIISGRIDDISTFQEECSHLLDDKTNKAISDLIETLSNKNMDTKEYKEQMNDIKIILYNGSQSVPEKYNVIEAITE